MSDEDDARPSITPTRDGPYVVRGVARLANRHGALAARPTMALCRCGGSAGKPFCDGTHARSGFSSAAGDAAPEGVAERFAGEDVVIVDRRRLCAHSGRCTDGLPGVFRYGQEPWIEPRGAAPEAVVATIRACPSGALRYEVDGVEGPPPEGEPAVFVSPNGPYVVTGGPDLVDPRAGGAAAHGRYALCRCGRSGNKPFCDGSHWSVGFEDERN